MNNPKMIAIDHNALLDVIRKSKLANIKNVENTPSGGGIRNPAGPELGKKTGSGDPNVDLQNKKALKPQDGFSLKVDSLKALEALAHVMGNRMGSMFKNQG